MTRWLVRLFVPDRDNVADPRVRRAYGLLEGWASIVVNVAVFAVKLVPGLMIGSISLVADAFHSLSDVVTSAVVIWGFKMSARPSDREHPFGHGRMESVASLVIAVLLFLTAWEFGKAGVERLLQPRQVAASPGLLFVLLLALLAKEWLSRFSRTLGQRIGSTALMADFWHHRSDVLATGVVIVALFLSDRGFWWVDGVGAIVVALFIAWAAAMLVRDSVQPLIGEAPSPQVLQEMRDAALSVPGIVEVHDMIVHRYGGLAVSSVHIEVPADMDIVRGHELAEQVEQNLNERFGGWAVVHVDPVNRDHPLYPEVEAFLRQTVREIPGAQGFHDLRIVGATDPLYVIFDLKHEGADVERVVGRLREGILSRFRQVAKVVVNVEPRYVY